jgi:hypothetical protein
MPRRTSTFAELAIAIGLVLGLERAAHAQACCVAPSTTGLGRLAMYETLLTGVEARGAAAYGSFDPDGRFRGAPRGTHDVTLEQNLFVTARLLSRGQGTVTLPFVETLRGGGGASSAGGGLGDVRLALRWDLVRSEDARPWPGVAVLAGVAMPTGVAPEKAERALATDATGTGTTQAWAGAAFEETRGPWLFMASGVVTVRADRTLDGVTCSLPPRFAAGLAVAHAWTSGFVVSFGGSYAAEGDASIGGARVPDTSRRTLQLTGAMQAPLGNGARLVLSTFVTPPIGVITAGEGASTGLSLAVIVPWS